MIPTTYKSDPAERRALTLMSAPSVHDYSSPETVERVNGFLARAAAVGIPKAEAVAAIVARNRARLDSDTLAQRHWQASVSRRPLRGRHWDSFLARERYVRCNPTNYWPPVTMPLAERVAWWGRKRKGV